MSTLPPTVGANADYFEVLCTPLPGCWTAARSRTVCRYEAARARIAPSFGGSSPIRLSFSPCSHIRFASRPIAVSHLFSNAVCRPRRQQRNMRPRAVTTPSFTRQEGQLPIAAVFNIRCCVRATMGRLANVWTSPAYRTFARLLLRDEAAADASSLRYTSDAPSAFSQRLCEATRSLENLIADELNGLFWYPRRLPARC